jgi:endonuclease YncB( thermonuclease family)
VTADTEEKEQPFRGLAPSSFSPPLTQQSTRPICKRRISLFLHPPKLGMVIRQLLTSFVLLLFPYSSFADFTGPVVFVLDGDTLEVLYNQHPEHILLSGIDCPEKGQPYGHQAKQATSAMVFGKEVILQTHGREKSGRTLADVLLPDGTHVSHILVKDG